MNEASTAAMSDYPTPRVAPGVFRHDCAGFRGFRVCINRRTGSVQRYFGVRAHGGVHQAQTAALDFAQRWQRVHGTVTTGGTRVHRGPVRAASGIRGVSCTRTSWMATWYDPPMRRHRVYCGTGAAGLRRATRVRAEGMRAKLRRLGVTA